MKILIIGNGFDLAHYLPTAYAHFMGVMKAIEELPEGKTEVTFDDLFGDLSKRESFFFNRMMDFYDVDQIFFDAEKIYKMKGVISNNRWYKYFSSHLDGVNTWIDFEQKMEDVLGRSWHFFDVFNKIKLKYAKVPTIIWDENYKEDDAIKLDALQLGFYKLFGLVLMRNGEDSRSRNKQKYFLSDKYFDVRFVEHYSKVYAGFPDKFFNELYCDLEVFVSAFDVYLDDVVGLFELKGDGFKGFLLGVDHVYSFNYTKTISRFYKFKENIDFLHGEAGNKIKKIVLGVSDLNDGLKDIKMYKFTKYHQKMMNGTDFGFLRYGNAVCQRMSKLEVFTEADHVDILIWGHSLDISDSDYIQEIFSIQDKDSGATNVVIYFHNNLSKSTMLSNLLHIVGREKIERWMKTGWLKFEQAPDLYNLNFAKDAE